MGCKVLCWAGCVVFLLFCLLFQQFFTPLFEKPSNTTAGFCLFFCNKFIKKPSFVLRKGLKKGLQERFKGGTLSKTTVGIKNKFKEVADAVAKRYRPWPPGLGLTACRGSTSLLVQGASRRLRNTDKVQYT